MAICPKCHKNVDYLIARVTEVSMYDYHDGNLQNCREQIQSEIDFFKCPLCCEDLDIPDQAAADAFLAGKNRGKRG